MSVAAVAWAFEQSLPPNEKVVLLALADCENGQSLACMPGQEHIAEKASMSVRSVRRMLIALEERGLIRRERRALDSGQRTSDSYTLALRANLSGGESNLTTVAGGNRPTVAGIGEPEDRTGSNTPPTPSADATEIVPEWFEEAWKAWPRKDGKAAARKAWLKAAPLHKKAALAGEVEGTPRDAPQWGDQALLRDAVSRFGHALGRTTAPRFIPHLSTWLNQERWTDPYPVEQTRGAYAPEPPKPAKFSVPAGHRPVFSEEGYVVGSEPIA